MTINCKGHLVDLKTPKVMGIINVTPDSFYDGGATLDIDQILNQAHKMLEEGASFLDVGGHSTRPGAAEVSTTQELERVLPAIRAILHHIPHALISVDTFKSEVARVCIEAGAAMINDVSGGQSDEKMLETVAQLQVPYVMMHSRGNPGNMQSMTDYEQITRDLLFYFSQQIDKARKLGINDLIVDPGFGFAKTLEQNYELLGQLDLLQSLKLPVLVGLSRKSMIYKLLEGSPDSALNGSTVLHTIALTKGANILRVHDVKEAAECIRLVKQLNLTENGFF